MTGLPEACAEPRRRLYRVRVWDSGLSPRDSGEVVELLEGEHYEFDDQYYSFTILGPAEPKDAAL